MIRAFSLFSTMAAMLVLFPFATPAADDANIRPEQVLSVVTADWNNDGGFDRAVLLESDKQPGGTELLIYLSEPKTDTMQLALRKTNSAWSGDMWGTLPRLDLDKDNNLVIHSHNGSIGRNRWHQSINVARKDEKFIVTSFTYEATDTLKPDYHLNCSMNFITGKGMRNGKLLKTPETDITLSNWQRELIYTICEKQTGWP